MTGAPALHEFLTSHRGEILSRSTANLGERETSSKGSEVVDGLPLFLDQLVTILRADDADRAAGEKNVSDSATLRGAQLQRIGLTVGQVVQNYGSICQSVTEVANQHGVTIGTGDFQTFNQCLDVAIAQAVTEYEHQRDGKAGGLGLAYLAHEMRNLLSTSMLTYDALVRGSVGIKGTTGALLGRSLRRMSVLIDRTIAEARFKAGIAQPERVSISDLIEEIEIVATIEANATQIALSVYPGASDVAVDADRQILSSVVTNLVQNALKFTRRPGHVTIRARTEGERVLIDVEDECGGLPAGNAEELFRPYEQFSENRTGLGIGLSISRQGARSCHGDSHVRDLPGFGCVFTVDLPRAPAQTGS